MEHISEQPAKSILVHGQHSHPQDQNIDPNTAPEPQPRKKSISWDEEGIEAYEKERGKIPKIPEPKTPYAADIDQGTIEEGGHDVDEVLDEKTKQNTLKNKHLVPGAIDAEELHRRILEQTSEQKEKEREREEEEADMQDQKHKAFLQKRKKHYDEGTKLRQILRKTSLDANEENGNKNKESPKEEKDEEREKSD